MRNKILMYAALLGTTLLGACGSDNGGGEDPTPPTPSTPDVPDTPDTGEDKVADGAIYNGIVLPGQWPIIRSYSSDIRKGMSPYYLSSKPAIVSVAVGRQLFVDDFLVEATTLKRVMHYPEYYAQNPVLSPDKEWESVGTGGAAFAAPFSDGLWYDEQDGKFKMWYMAGGGSYSVNSAGVTCYAESADGITWTKPSLQVVAGTNIVDKGSERDASTIWLDKQETNASKRYKMFQVAGGSGKWKYHYKTSANGLQWRDNATPSGAVADRSTVYKNPFRDVWAWSMRHNVRVKSSDAYTVRARDYYENADPAVGNQNAKADLSRFWFGPWQNEQKHPVYSNDDGSPGIYNLDAIPYESIMLGFFSVWQGPENNVCSSDNVIKRNQVMVGYSRDGYSWFREDMSPFLAVSDNRSAWNNGNVQSVVGSPVIKDDKLYFYVSGRRLNGDKEITSTGLATLRRDGFASMSGSGELTTVPMVFNGEYFFVNADVRGELRVEILDKNGNVVSGFSKDDCHAVTGNSTKKKVEWATNATLAKLKGKAIKVRFYLSDADLYAFWISPDATGKSQGYTAGGGPGLDASGIDK